MKNYAFIISSILYLYILKLIHFIYSYLFTHHQCSAVVSPSPITPAQSLHALAHRTATIDDGFGVAGQWDGDQTLQRDSTDWLAPSDFVKYRTRMPIKSLCGSSHPLNHHQRRPHSPGRIIKTKTLLATCSFLVSFQCQLSQPGAGGLCFQLVPFEGWERGC